MKDINSRKDGYIAYFAVLMVWEVIPTYIIVFFFRVRLPSHSVSVCMHIYALDIQCMCMHVCVSGEE